MQDCFIDVFFVTVFKALTQTFEGNPSLSGTVTFQFTEYDWSKSITCNQLGNTHEPHVGEVIFVLKTNAQTKLKLVTHNNIVQFMSAISASQTCSADEDIQEYTLRFPCRASDVELDVKPKYMINDTDCSDDSSCRRILIVDDDSTFRENLEQFLKSECHCTVQHAANGELGRLHIALSIAENKSYDVIFVDLLMPTLNGIEMMRDLLDHHGSINPNTAGIAMIGIEDQFDQFIEDFDGDPSSYGFSAIT